MSIKIISGHVVFNENAVVMSKKFDWNLENEFNPQPGDLYIVFGGHELAHQLLEVQFRKNSSFGYIIMNSEQINSQFFRNKYYIQLMKRNVVFDYNTITSDYLKKAHEVKCLSFYFFEFMKFNSETNDRPYDITFIGSKTEDRVKLMKDLEEEFNDLKFYVDFDWKHASPQSMTDVLQKSKVVLNLAYYTQSRPLESHRINKALACECDVVSTLSDDHDANDFYKDYCYMTDDVKNTLHKYFNEELDKKKKYEELVKELSQKFNPHMKFIVDHIHHKLLSLHYNNEPATEVVSQQTTSDSDIPTNTETEEQVGESV
jgi:hypothetical protein